MSGSGGQRGPAWGPDGGSYGSFQQSMPMAGQQAYGGAQTFNPPAWTHDAYLSALSRGSGQYGTDMRMQPNPGMGGIWQNDTNPGYSLTPPGRGMMPSAPFNPQPAPPRDMRTYYGAELNPMGTADASIWQNEVNPGYSLTGMMGGRAY